jgi:5-methylthioadenosine/S-adenosylhomocysteine deaminase
MIEHPMSNPGADVSAAPDAAATLIVSGALVPPGAQDGRWAAPGATRVGGVGERVDIVVAGRHIRAIEPHRPDRPASAGTRVLDARGTAALPGLVNAHTHNGMTIMRSYADDMPLMPWLQEKIWPFEARMTPEDVYWSNRLGCIEMIRTGTTCFSDMYWHFEQTATAVMDSGLRAQLAAALADFGAADRAEEQKAVARDVVAGRNRFGSRITLAFGPHANYTVSGATLGWLAETAAANDIPLHIHLSETAGEVANCVRDTGLRPPAYLDSLGVLGPRTFAAHCVHLDDAEIALLAERGVHALHNPKSNLKLASGGPMRYRDMRAAGVSVLVGTDSVASNNSLDMFEELQFAALLAKHAAGDPTVLPAGEALGLATSAAADALRLPIGRIAPGRLADLVLIDLAHPMMFPGHDLAADVIYSANGRAVQSTVCDGQVLMESGVVADEAEIRAEVVGRLGRLVGR